MKEKLKIGVDIDEVLAELAESVLDFYNKKFHTNFKKEEIKEIHLEKLLKISSKEMRDIFEEFSVTGENLNLIPVKDSINSLKKLNEYELYAISARPKSIKDHTVEWIEKHYESCFKEIHLLSDSHGVGNFDKGFFAKEIGIKFFIEDSLKNSLDIASHDIHVILLDKPWNQEENLPENIYRVKDWNEILQKIEDLKNVI